VINKETNGVEKKILVDDTEIKIKNPQMSEARPEYRCTRCDMLFPSQLDLSEHEKVDHAKTSISA
jgi:uncharacterized C2H2 Zn-finger protein